MSERRNTKRQKSFLRGCIYFNNRRSALDCLIRDISDTGCRVIFSSAVQIPDVVDLYIPQKEQTLRAIVQWRQGEEAGIAFGEAARAPAAPVMNDVAELSGRVQKLEAEIAALRKVLKRLKADMSGGADNEAA
jgi:uncharacterized small protein (DUF1192 family)